MNSKFQTIYVCSNCDAQFTKWNGRCLECGGWGTLKQQTVDQKEIKSNQQSMISAKLMKLSEAGNKEIQKIETKIKEFDRVVGGGIVPGSVILIAGEPGIGKSTIVAQISGSIAKNYANEKNAAIYVSGEESATQIKSRFERLNCQADNISLVAETNIEKINNSLKDIKPKLVIIDSIQTIYSYDIESEAGSISQIRGSAVKLLELAKENNVAVIIIGHITKDGLIAGPKSLEHIVDTVIYFESEIRGDFTILRAVKNRFGSVNELGVFEMTSEGFKEVNNPSAIFLGEQGQGITGTVISSIIEGTRPFLIEVQALVTKTVFGYPQRKSSGFDLNRLQVLTAVLTKRAKINLTNQDVILNIVGGIKISDPTLDLAVSMAIASSLLNQAISRETIVLGEVGLGGEIRNVSKIDQRLKEAERQGFTKAIIPNASFTSSKMKLQKINNLNEIISQL